MPNQNSGKDSEESSKASQIAGKNANPQSLEGQVGNPLDIRITFYEYGALSEACMLGKSMQFGAEEVPDSLLSRMLEFDYLELEKAKKIRTRKNNRYYYWPFGQEEIGEGDELSLGWADALSYKKMIEDKWAYVFVQPCDSDLELFLGSEFKIKCQGSTQNFTFSYPCKNETGENGKKVTVFPWNNLFSFDSSFESYVFLSKYRLPQSRIQYYLDNFESLKKRALHIDKESYAKLKDELQPIRVDLLVIDFLDIALAFHKEYEQANKAKNDELKDNVQNKKRLLTECVYGICQANPKFAKKIRFDDMKKFYSEQNQLLQEKDAMFQNAATRTYSWAKKPGFYDTLEDYKSAEIETNFADKDKKALSTFDFIEKFVLELLAGCEASKAGLEYLQDSRTFGFLQGLMFGDAWIERWRKNVDAVKGITEGIVNELKNRVVDDFFTLFFHYMISYNITALKNSKWAEKKFGPWTSSERELMQEVNTSALEKIKDLKALLKKREIPEFRKVATDTIGDTYELFYETRDGQIKLDMFVLTEDEELNIHKKEQATPRKKADLGKIGVVVGLVLIPIELTNLINSIQNLEERSEAKDYIEITGNFMDTLQSLDVVAKMVEKDLPATSVFKLALSSATFTGASVIGAVCDYVGAIFGMRKYKAERKYELMWCHSVVALGAVATLIAADTFFTGEVILLMGTGVWGLIALVLMGVGSILIYVFTEEPIEEWLRSCLWTKEIEDINDEPLTHLLSTWPKIWDVSNEAGEQWKNVMKPISESELDRELRSLQEILTKFDVTCGWYDEISVVNPHAKIKTYDSDLKGIGLRVSCGLFNTQKSKYILKNLGIRDSEGKIIVYESGPLTLSSHGSIARPTYKDKIVKYLDVIWEWEALKQEFGWQEGAHPVRSRSCTVNNREIYESGDFECEIQLDMDGDGKNLYPSFPQRKKGELQVIKNEV